MSSTVSSSSSRETPMLDSQMLEALYRERRATPGFRADPVPLQIIDKVLRLAGEAPSGFNFQPWRFLVLRSRQQRDRLRRAANDQAKVSEAPLVIVALADRSTWRDAVDEILATRAARTGEEQGEIKEAKKSALSFVDTVPSEVWLTRQVMIAFTYLMLGFEAFGWDTAPMEGFDPAKVRAELNLPDSAEIIALLAVGKGSESSALHPGRLPVERIAFDETYGTPWPGLKRRVGNPAYPPEVTPA